MSVSRMEKLLEKAIDNQDRTRVEVSAIATKIDQLQRDYARLRDKIYGNGGVSLLDKLGRMETEIEQLRVQLDSLTGRADTKDSTARDRSQAIYSAAVAGVVSVVVWVVTTQLR